MDAKAALAELLELSSQVEAAAILGADGSLVAATVQDEARAERLARCGRELLEAAGNVRAAGPAVTRVEVALARGSTFAVREGERTIVATTVPEPTSGLVVYDLRTALRRLEDEKEKPKAARRPRAKAQGDA
jgi:predicted regulator of Ras-like GTPase activity (Roadblock/LC7/MglB family)